MIARPKTPQAVKQVAEWPLSPAATLGSAVRAKGILLEARAHIPFPARKFLDVEAGRLVLGVPQDSKDVFHHVIESVARTVRHSESLPVIPREVEDILTITSGERHRWLKDNRLRSAGTRTVKLRGRARAITFHVFDPRHIEDVLDRDLVSIWRQDDATAAAENTRRAAGKAAQVRAGKLARKKEASSQGKKPADASPGLEGWDDFDREGLLR
jgi:hypothetical protein